MSRTTTSHTTAPCGEPFDVRRLPADDEHMSEVRASVYILRCADGTYYVGSTRHLDRRVWEHDEGLGSAYTRRWGRRPVALVWSAEYESLEQAFLCEKQIQGWGRAKREALIRGEVELLPGLAKKDFSPKSRPGLESRSLLLSPRLATPLVPRGYSTNVHRLAAGR